MTLSQGDRLGRYEILGPIGAGGMGEVWRALDTDLDRQVAVKVLPAEVAASPERRKRFEREARATAALNHPHLLTIHDIGIDNDQPYLVTELLEGETLRQVLRRGPCSPGTAVSWSLGIARGLSAAHAKGIVHRDLKPDNVFITIEEQLRILDFGLAKIFEPEKNDTTNDETVSDDTSSGAVLGTMGYMAPEQLRGDPVDCRTDYFAFGCVLFEMLSGRRPFAGGSSAEHFSAVLRDDPAPLDEKLPVNLRAVVRRCLEKRPAARYQSAGEVVAALESLDPSSLSGVPGIRPSSGIRSSSGGAEPAVAVMPFANLSGDTDQEYLCDGMAEEILGAIGKIRGLQVLARSSSFAFKGTDADPREIGRTIGADHLLEGSVHRLGDRIRISARLVQATNGTQIWADRYDRTISDIFALQDEISVEVANQLRTALLEDELAKLKEGHVPAKEAYDLYQRGRYLWYRRAEGDLMQAVSLFEQAIAHDAKYADPHAGIGMVFNALGAWGFMPSRPAFSRARESINLALELDDQNAPTHGALGYIAAYHDWDAKAGEHHLTTAIRLDPANGWYRCWYAGLRNMQGRHEEAGELAIKAINTEPMSGIIQNVGGYNLHWSDPDRALNLMKHGLDMEPRNPVCGIYYGFFLGDFHGRMEEAIAPLEQSADLGWIPSLGVLAAFHSKLGNHEQASRISAKISAIAHQRYVSPMTLALVAAGKFEVDKTLEMLEASVESGELYSPFFRLYPIFSFVHEHPRFVELQDRIGLWEG